jgi:hypothetical protein
MTKAADHLYDVLRYVLPYGLWTLADGRQVLFDRDYRPMWVRQPGERAMAADPAWWVPYTRQGWLFDDACAPWFAHDQRVQAPYRRAGEAAQRRCWRVLDAFLNGRALPPEAFDEGAWASAPEAAPWWRDPPPIVPSRKRAVEREARP